MPPAIPADSLPSSHKIGPSETVTGCCQRIPRDPCHYSESDKVGYQDFSIVDHIACQMSRLYDTLRCNIFNTLNTCQNWAWCARIQENRNRSRPNLTLYHLLQRSNPALREFLPAATPPKCGAIFDSFF
jgi:hypothetical protein